MTKELIKITTNEEGQQLVSARELHEFLEVKSRFNDWISNRIKKYDFEENIDYIMLTKNLVTNNIKNPISECTEYIITTDMAKELSMVENNDKGRQARKYFIECEKKLKNVSQLLTEEQKLQLAVMNSNTVEECRVASASLDRFRRQEIAEQQKQLKLQASKVEYHDKVLSDEGLLTATLIAKSFGMSARRLNEILKKENVQYKQSNCWLPYASYDGKGYCRIVHTTYGDQLQWTQKGKKFIWGLLINKGYITDNTIDEGLYNEIMAL